MQRRAQKAVTAVAVVFLVVNAFLSFRWPEDLSYDPTEVSRRLAGTYTIRDRIINSLRERRGVKPGDQDFQRLFLARLSEFQEKSDVQVSRRVTLRTLEKAKQIWMRPNKELQNELQETRKLQVSNYEGVLNKIEPLSVCGRPTNVGTRSDLALLEHGQVAGVDNSCPGANSNKMLLIQGRVSYGRTGNNMIEFLHALQYAHDNDVTLGITHDSWVFNMLLGMFMSIQDTSEWQHQFEKAFCVKIFYNDSKFDDWDIVQWDDLAVLGEGRGLLGLDQNYLTSKKMFLYISQSPLLDYIAHQSKNLQSLFRYYNTGKGTTNRGVPVRNMCSGIDAVFGADNKEVIYSTIHQRSMEGQAGITLMQRMSKASGCHPTAAISMEPEYVKSILRPLGMLNHPIVLITDGQDFNIIRRLINDPEIGPKLRLVPEGASWVGGDITLAVMSNVFIGNPASTFSGFIAKSRLALGFGHSYLFRAQNEKGEWHTVCGDTCVFDKKVMGSIS